MGFVRDPRVGLPLLLLAEAAILLAVLRPKAGPRRTGWELPPREPDRDAVSRTYLALRRGMFSPVLHESYDRLDRAVRARTGRALYELPWLARSASRLGLRDAQGLYRLRNRIDAYELWALRLESDSWLRHDFWRSQESSRAKFLERLPPLFDRIDARLELLKETP